LMTSFERGFQDADTGYRRIIKLVHWRPDGKPLVKADGTL